MKKKLIAGVLAFAMLLGAVGCGKKNDPGNDTGSNTVAAEDLKDCIYKLDDNKFDGFVGDVSWESIISGNLVVCTNEYEEVVFNDEGVEVASYSDAESVDDEEMGVSTLRIYTTPISGGTAKLIYEEENCSKYVNDLFEVNGKIGIFLCENNNNGKETGKIAVIDMDGNIVKDIDVSFAYKEDSYPSYILYFENDDTILIGYDESVTATDTKGKEKFSLSTNGYLLSLGITKDDLPIVYIYANEGEILKTIDLKKGAFKDTCTIEGGLASSELQKGADDYDVFYSGASAAYGLKLADGSVTKICDYTASDIDTTNFFKGMVADKETIILEMRDYDTYTSTFEEYKKINPADYVEKKELKLMCLYAPSEIRSMVVEYNKTHSDYRIQIVDYGEFDNSYEKLAADLAVGKYGDIYYLNGGLGDYSTDLCAAKGMFEDLTPYLEKDPDVSKDDLVTSVYEASKIDGKVYYLGGHFTVRSLLGKKSELGDRKGWTFEDMKDYVESKPADCRIFENTNKSSVLGTFLSTSMGDFVDWEKGECYFDSPEFKSVLEMCNRGNNDEENWEEIECVNDIASGKQLFVEGLVDLDEIAFYDSVFRGDISYIGYPNADKEGVYGSISDAFAMSSVCSDKDAAWEFIKTIISKDYQLKNYWESGFGCPTRKDVLEMYMKSYTTKEDYTDEYGNRIEARKGTFGYDEIEVEIKPITTDQEAFFRDQINRISRIWTWDTSLYDIIAEEAQAYFAGDKSLDETASLIQNRAYTYVQENR